MENYSWNEHTIEEYKRDIQRMSKEDFKSEIERFVATCQLEDGDTNEMLRDSLIIDIFKNLSLFEQIEVEMSYLTHDKDDDYYSSDLNVAHENIIFDSAMDLNLVNQDWFDDRLKHSPIERMYELHDAIKEQLCLHYGQFYDNVWYGTKHMSKFLEHLLDRYVSSESLYPKMEKVDLIWDSIIEQDIATIEELRLVCSINGYNVETLESVIYSRVGYRSLEQWMECEPECFNV